MKSLMLMCAVGVAVTVIAILSRRTRRLEILPLEMTKERREILLRYASDDAAKCATYMLPTD